MNLRWFLIAITIIVLTPVATHAQVQYEVTCPSGMSSVSSLATYDTATSKFRQNVCVDTYGNIIFNSSIGIGNSSTDNTTQLQAIINTVPSFTLPCGTFVVTSTLLIPVNRATDISGLGDCTKIMKNFDSTPLFQSATQTYGQQTNLSANVATGNQQLTVVSSSSFTVNGWIQIDDNSGTTANCTSYAAYEPVALSCNLEIHQIASIPDGTHINIKDSIDGTFTTAASGRISAITPVFVKLHNFAIINGPNCTTPNSCTGRGIDLVFPVDTDVYNLTIDIGSNIAAQQFHRCKETYVFRNNIRNGNDSLTRNGLGANAAIFDEGCSHWSFDHNKLSKFSEAVAQGMSHHFAMDNNDANGCGDDCFNTHGSLNHDGSISGNVMGGGAFANVQNTVSARCIIISDTDFNMVVNDNTCRNWVTSCIQATATTQFSISNIVLNGNHCSGPITSTGTFPPNNFLSTTTNPPQAFNLAGIDGLVATSNHITGAFPANSLGFQCVSCRRVLFSLNEAIQTASVAGDIGFYVTTNASQPASDYTYTSNVSRGWTSACFRWDLGASTFAGLSLMSNDTNGCATPYVFGAGITNISGATPTFSLCGTTTTCAQTNQTKSITVNGGPIALVAGTLTITSLPFTSSTSYVCSADDSTGINGIDVVYNSGSSVTFNGTGTDSIRYSCIGN